MAAFSDWSRTTESLRRGLASLQAIDEWWQGRLLETGPSAIARAWLGLRATAWKAWRLLTIVLALLIEAVAALLGVVLTTADGTLGWALSAVLWPVEGLFSLPYLGRGLSLLWRIVLTLFWTIVSLPDALLALAGILPEKRLRLWVLLPAREGVDDRDRQRMLEAVSIAGRILRRQANVRLIPCSDFVFDYAFSRADIAYQGWLKLEPAPGLPVRLEVGCAGRALLEDLGPLGGQLERWGLKHQPRGAYRRVLGYGAPLAALGVESVSQGRLAGCSLGPLVDYLTLAINQPVCLAHEIGHACNLPHLESPMNLMKPTCGGLHLTRWQVALLRLSRHVTYL